MSGNILVTGGSGFLGSHIVDALGEMPESAVCVYDIQTTDRSEGNSSNINGDIFDSDRLIEVMRGNEISSVIHLVGFPSIPRCESNPYTSYRLNVSSVRRILEAMRISEAEQLVFSSTGGVYGARNGPKASEQVDPKPTHVYGSHKLMAELLIQEYAESYGFDATILRIFNVYGDLEKEHGVITQFIRKALANDPLIVEGGDQVRDFVHLKDVEKAFVNSLNKDAASGKVINVGSGFGTSINEVAMFVKQFFPKIEIKRGPPRKGDYDLYADISRMNTILSCNAVNPRVGIPAFIKQCKQKSQ